eukprot:scaffold1991_cov111-Isochrysis_galbana.AAC.16
MPRAEHCEGGRREGGERVPPPFLVLVMSCLLKVCLLVRRSLISLGPGAEGRSYYLGGGSLLRLPPRAELRAAEADEERTPVQRGSADLDRDHASKLRIRIIQ